MADLFLSYAHADSDFVRRLHAALVSAGKEAWIDLRDIPPSLDWHEQIETGIDGADNFVFVLSPAALKSKECADELEYAERRGKRIVPVVRVAPDDGHSVPRELARHHWVFFREEDDFDAALGKLIEALETDAQRLREHSTVLVAAKRWEGHRRDRSYLIRGGMLNAAEGLMAAADQRPALTPLQREYIEASRRAALGRQRLLLAGVSIAFLVALALAVLAFIQRNDAISQRKHATSLALASAATSNVTTDPQLSVELARAAVDESATIQASDALRLAVGAVQLVRVFAGHRGHVNSVGFSPDGSMLVTASDDRTARVWNTRTGATLGVLRGATDDVQAAFFDPTGRTVAAVSSDGETRLWQARTGRLLSTMRSSTGPGGEAFFAGGGTQLVTADPSGVLRLWQSRTGRLMRSVRASAQQLTAAAISPDGRRLAVGDAAGVVRVWDLRSGRVARLPGTQTANHIAFSPDGRLLAIAGGQGITTLETARGLIKARLGAGLPPFSGLTLGDVSDAEFSPNGRYVAVAIAMPGIVRVFQTDGQLVSTLRSQAGLRAVRFRNDSRFLLTTGGTTPVVWDAVTGDQVALLAGHTGAVTDAVFSPDGRYVATASQDETARLWVASSGRLTELLPQPQLVSAAISRSGRVLTAGSQNAAVWDIHTGRRLSVLGAGATLADAALSPDGTLVALQTARTLEVLPATGGTLTVMEGAGTPATAGSGPRGGPGGPPGNSPGRPPSTLISFSPDGRRLLGSARDGSLRLWDPRTGRAAVTLQGRPGPVTQATFSPDGTRVVAVGQDGVARFWLAATGRPLPGLRSAGRVSAAVISSDDRLILTAGGGGGGPGSTPGGGLGGAGGPGRSRPSARTGTTGGSGARGSARSGAPLSATGLWDADTGRLISPLTGAGFGGRVAFSQDGHRFATAGSDGVIRVWDTGLRAILSTLIGHGGAIGALVFSPDDRLVLTTSIDETARLWDPATGLQLATLRGAAGGVSSAKFSPDGSSILTTSDDNYARLYACRLCGPIGTVLAAAGQLVPRTLTAAQRQLYLGQSPVSR